MMNDSGTAGDAVPETLATAEGGAVAGGRGDGAREHGAAPDWDAVRSAYCGSDLTIVQVCASFGITKGQLYWQVRKNGWPMRAAAERRRMVDGSAGVPVPTTPSGVRAWRKGMIARLYEAMDRQLGEIERQQRTGLDMSGPDRERQMRQMNVMTKSMQQLTEFYEQEAKRSAKPGRGKKRAGDRDPETWRLEIAERIARIRKQWLAEEAARKA